MSIRLLRFARPRSLDPLRAFSFCLAGCMTSGILLLTQAIAG